MDKKKAYTAAAVLTLLTSVNIVLCAAIKLPEKRAVANAMFESGDEQYFSHAMLGEAYLTVACITQLLPIILSIILILKCKKGVAIALLVISSLFLTARLAALIIANGVFTPAQYAYTLFPALMRAASVVMIITALKDDRKAIPDKE